MPRGRKTSPEIQWAIVRLCEYLDYEQIAMCLDTSTRTVKRLHSHFCTYGTIPNPAEQPAQQDIDIEEPMGLPTETLGMHTQSSSVQPFGMQMGHPGFPGGYGYPPYCVVILPCGTTVQVYHGPYGTFYPPNQPTGIQPHLPSPSPSPSHHDAASLAHIATTPHDTPRSSSPTPLTSIPDIVSWFSYLDRHEGRNQDGVTYAPFGHTLEAKGFIHLSQLDCKYVQPSDLQAWLGIKFGTAISILDYAKEDLEAVRSGKWVLPRD